MCSSLWQKKAHEQNFIKCSYSCFSVCLARSNSKVGILSISSEIAYFNFFLLVELYRTINDEITMIPTYSPFSVSNEVVNISFLLVWMLFDAFYVSKIAFKFFFAVIFRSPDTRMEHLDGTFFSIFQQSYKVLMHSICCLWSDSDVK